MTVPVEYGQIRVEKEIEECFVVLEIKMLVNL